VSLSLSEPIGRPIGREKCAAACRPVDGPRV